MSRFDGDDDDEADDREVSAALTVGEGDVDASLRPRTLGEFIGQPRVREQLQLVIQGAKNRGSTPDHILLSGPPGLGKTSLAMIIAAELGSSLRVTSGPALERAGDLAAMLSNLVEHDVLFIDEIHRIARPAEEMLYLAMEDFRVDVVVGKGPGATSIPLEVAPFTLVGATTRSGALTGPLRDRFGFTAHMDFYEPAELERVLSRSAGILGIELGGEAGAEIARRSRGTPRIANRLLRRVRDFAEVRADGVITRDVAKSALAVYDVDELGLDRLDRAVLSALTRSFGGGPVGVSTLAVAVGEEATTVEEVCEPFLVRAGMIARTPRGRVATPQAWTHLGMTPPASGQRFRATGTVRVGGRDDHRSIGIRRIGRCAACLHLHDGVADLDQPTHPRRVRYDSRGSRNHQAARVQPGLLQPFPGDCRRRRYRRSCVGAQRYWRCTYLRRRRINGRGGGRVAGVGAGQGPRGTDPGHVPGARRRSVGDRSPRPLILRNPLVAGAPGTRHRSWTVRASDSAHGC